MAYITKKTTVNGVKPIGSNLFGTCSTASATAAKVVTMPDFDVLVNGVTIHVQFTNANTANSPTLKVGSTNAVPIQRNGASEGVWENGSVISFTYNGTHWVQNDADNKGSNYGLKYNALTGILSIVENGGSSSVTIPDSNTTYTLGTANGQLWLYGSDGTNTSVPLPHLVKNLETITHSFYVNTDGVGYDYEEDNYVTNNDGYEYLSHDDVVYIVDSVGRNITGISEYNLNHNWTIQEASTFGQNLFDYFATHDAYRLKINGELSQQIVKSGLSGTQTADDYDTVIAREWVHDGIDYFRVYAEGVVLGQHNTIEFRNMNGTVDVIELKAIDIGALPTSQYHANTVFRDGYVTAPGRASANLVWKTDANGNPDWRPDDGGGASLKYTKDVPDGTTTHNVVQNDVENNVASGGYALAEGDHTTASGQRSHAEGFHTTARGYASHAEGRYTKAIGYASHAEGGDDATAEGDYSHAEGQGTKANGDWSHAEGYDTFAVGDYSHSEGYITHANGDNSHAQNLGTIAGYDNQTVLGKYNSNKSNHALEIGNGTNLSPSNSLAVTWDGDVEMALDTAATSGTDKEIYDALVSLGWTDVIV